MTEFLAGLVVLWWVFPISIGICIIACTLAMEGAVLFAPSFLFFFPLISVAFPEMSANEAIGVALAIEFFGFGSASIGYMRQRVVDKRLALRLLTMSVPFAIVARLVAFGIPAYILFILFGLVLLLLAYIVMRSYLAHRKLTMAGVAPLGGGSDGAPSGDAIERTIVARDGRSYQYRYHLKLSDRLNTAIAGSLVGLIGVGVGEIVNTMLMVRHNLPMRVATGTAVLVVTATVLIGSLTHLAVVMFSGEGALGFQWTIVALAAPAVLIGGQIAPHVSARFSEDTLKKALMFMFVFTGSIMLLRGIGVLA